MISFMKRKGDRGLTDLANAKNVSKADPRVFALADLDFLSCALGLAKAEEPSLAQKLERMQEALIDIMAVAAGAKKTAPQKYLAFLDREVSAMQKTLPPLKRFVLPGTSRADSALHFCRASARRAECALVAARAPASVLAFANRLSLWLFLLSRENRY
jgi:cob(I)alamin adenosyltransferase